MPSATGSMPSEARLAEIVGRRFPGGTYTIAHWENVLLTGRAGADPLPDQTLAGAATVVTPADWESEG